MAYREIIAVYSEIHIKHTNKLCGQNVNFLNVNPRGTWTNNTTNVVIQQNSRELLMMDISMSETCWAHKKWNKIASDIKLVFYSSIICHGVGPLVDPFRSHVLMKA